MSNSADEAQIPERFTYPFRYKPHPLIVKAAAALCDRIASDPALDSLFRDGKMLGTLMVSSPDG